MKKVALSNQELMSRIENNAASTADLLNELEKKVEAGDTETINWLSLAKLNHGHAHTAMRRVAKVIA